MSKILTVQLPEEGLDKYVSMRNPMFMRWKEQRSMQQNDGEDGIAYSTRLLKFLVIGGNIQAEDGRPLAYPLSDVDIDELTNYTIQAVMNAFKDAMDSVQPPKNS